MTPRNTQLGASASALRAPSPRAVRSCVCEAFPHNNKAPVSRRDKAGRPAARGRTPRDRSPLVAAPARRHRGRVALRRRLLSRRSRAVPRDPAARQAPGRTRRDPRSQRSAPCRGRASAYPGGGRGLRPPAARHGEDGASTRSSSWTAPSRRRLPSPRVLPHIDSQEAVKPPVGPWTAFLDAVFGVQ